jgi:hypothetical protein
LANPRIARKGLDRTDYDSAIDAEAESDET